MAARKFTSSELIDCIRKNAGYTDVESEGTTDADLLRYINEEIFGIYAEIMNTHEDFFLVSDRITVVSGTTKYRIPHRAMFSKIRDVIAYGTTDSAYPIERISRENRTLYFDTPSTYPVQYFVEGNHIVLYPGTSGGYLEVCYYFRPGELVPEEDCRQVSSVNLLTGAIIVDSAVPSTWTTAVKFDIHDNYSGATPKNWDLTASVVSGTGMTFTATDINGSLTGRFPVTVGDWVCETETSALPGIPRELHPLIAQAVIVRYSEKRDPEAFPVMKAEYEKMLERTRSVLAMRDEGAGEKVTLLNSPFIGR